MNHRSVKNLRLSCMSLMILAGALLFAGGVQAADSKAKLDQLALMKQFTGAWERDSGAGVVYGFDIREFGDAAVQINYQIAGGKKKLHFLYSYFFAPKEGKFRLVGHTPDGKMQKWIGSFSAPNTFNLEMVHDFISKRVLRRHVVTLNGKSGFELNAFEPDGSKIETTKWSRVQ